MSHRLVMFGIVAAVFLGGSALARADEESSMDALLRTLAERGVIDEAEYTELVAKNEVYEEKQKSLLPKLSFWGDFRGRYEAVRFDRDPVSDRDDRHRIRYRFRLNGKAELNDHASLLFRLASGDDDNRSTNQTLGSELDFDSDPIRIDLAYVRITPFPDLQGTSLAVEFGKVKNPFRWQQGKDWMLWDGDITPEGGSVKLKHDLSEAVRLFANAGYYVIDENGEAKDPNLFGAQFGAHVAASETVGFGGRATWYSFNSLNTAFAERSADSGLSPSVTSGGGTILDGLTGDPDGGSMSAFELGAYVAFSGVEAWPMLLYGNFSQNLDAARSNLNMVPIPNAGKEDTAWGVGFEIGNKKEFVLLGIGYWHVEANAFPSMYIDSNLFDGSTNREGFAVYSSRQIWKNTDLNLTLFSSDSIEDETPTFDDSLSGSDRVRLQADLVFKF